MVRSRVRAAIEVARSDAEEAVRELEPSRVLGYCIRIFEYENKGAKFRHKRGETTKRCCAKWHCSRQVARPAKSLRDSKTIFFREESEF